LKKQQERVCRFVYNNVLTAECTQVNNSWSDENDPRQSNDNDDYTELCSNWFAINTTNFSALGNETSFAIQG
jgi:hypothetical protein